MATDSRRTAADARRIAGNGADKDAVKKVREALKDNYERGVAAGREGLAAELDAADPRTSMLNFVAEMCDNAAARTSVIPNSNKALSAYGEAAAILRDAAKGEAPVGVEPESEETPGPKSAAKTRRKASK
jgi:phage gp36-like protein